MRGAFPDRTLLITDHSRNAALAKKVAADLCERTGSRLHAVCVGRNLPGRGRCIRDPRIHPDLPASNFGGDLDGRATAARRFGAVAAAYLRLRDPAVEIAELVEDLRVGLIVSGTGELVPADRYASGGALARVVRLSSCPLLVARGDEDAWPPSRVVIGDDDSRGAEAAGELAAAIGALFGADVVLVRAYPEFQVMSDASKAARPRKTGDQPRRKKRTLLERAEALEDLLGVHPRARVAPGDAATLILDETRRAGRAMVAVGTADRVRDANEGSCGVLAEVLRGAEGPILIAPPRNAQR